MGSTAFSWWEGEEALAEVKVYLGGWIALMAEHVEKRLRWKETTCSEKILSMKLKEHVGVDWADVK